MPTVYTFPPSKRYAAVVRGGNGSVAEYWSDCMSAIDAWLHDRTDGCLYWFVRDWATEEGRCLKGSMF